ncbi:unnamed protein product, partial [Polarella glacialis]
GQSPRVGNRGRARIACSAELAPSIVRPDANPGLPDPLDKKRYGEQVRWLLDEDAVKPPEWHVLLLGKTFDDRKNTVYRVTASLMAVLPLTLAEATRKADHARDHFFSVVDTTPDWSQAIRVAQALQLRGLAIRVVPGFAKDDGKREEEASDGAGEEDGAVASQKMGRRR